MKYTKIASINELGDGCSLQAVRGRVTKYITSKSGEKKDGTEWKFDVIKLKDESGEIEAKLWNQEGNVKRLVGSAIEIIAGEDKRSGKPRGLLVADDGKHPAQLSVNECCQINVIDGDRNEGEPQRQTDNRTQAPGKVAGKEPRLGQNTGMCINNAVNVILRSGAFPSHEDYFKGRDFARDLAAVAGAIARVSDWLEAGNLPPLAAGDKKPSSYMTEPEPAERNEQPAQAARKAAEKWDDSDSGHESPEDTGLADDDIPF